MANGNSPTPAFLQGGGDMGALMRAHDWAGSPLGPPAAWPESLRSTLGLCLDSAFPIAIYWGPQLALLYNDAWRPILGDKHPWGLGRPAREVWPEIWEAIDPVFEQVRATGKGVFNGDSLLAMKRYGYVEECYFDYTFNPIRAGAEVAGIFNVVIETTYRVINERRARFQRDFAARLAPARSVDQVLALAAETLAAGSQDVPFALLYRGTRLAHAVGVEAGAAALAWPLDEVMESGRARHVAGLAALPGGPWPEPAREALVLPVSAGSESKPAALLVAGISPRRALDDEYRAFFDSLASHMARAMASAEAFATQIQRAEALAELDRAKTAFFSNVSHEFRTPLTLMLGPVEDLLGEPGERVAADRTTLEAVHRNGQRLLKLVNTLLDFARIEAGRMQASFEPTDLAAYTAELASNFRSACERAGLELQVECPPLAEPAHVDREMWEKVVLNLLSNAFKFTLAGSIRVSLRAEPEYFELEVRDTGAGIPAHELPHMFERFHRVEGTPGRSHEGSGIGLALVNELVKLHGGEISVQSERGAGSVFRVRVPRGSAHLPAGQLRPAREPAARPLRADAYVEEALSWLPAPQAAAGKADAAGLPRVLVADDNADLREYVRGLLAGHYDVHTEPDGEAALAAARARPPELIVSDVMMPRLDGFGLIRALRAEPRLKDIPVVLLSARAGEEARLEGLGKGADDYVAKPFSARELLVRIGALLQSSRARRSAMEEASRLSAVAAVGLTRFSRDLRYLSVNPAYAELIGARVEDIEGKPIVEVMGEEAFRAIQPYIERVLAGEEDVSYEQRLRYPRGPRWIHASYRPDRDESGQVAGWVASVMDITHRRDAEDALREADRRKDEFIATLSHELRNPLAPLKNSLQLLKLTAQPDREVAPVREMMERQVDHLVRLVDDLLEMSRITSGALELRKEHIALAAVVKDAVDAAQPLVQASHQQLGVRLPEEPLWLHGDPVRLAQLLGNLLNNAAKYAGPRGEVELSARREGATAEVSVRDNGPGISPELLPRVFDMFTRGSDAATRSQSGLGIGLALARRLAEMHGGTLEARSGRGGAEFLLRLPLAAPQQTAASELSPAGERTSGARVLVVDDNRDAAQSLAALLQLAGSDTLVAHGGEEALVLARQHRPDVVLLDIGMPGMDGYAACRALRAAPDGQAMKIVALTGWGQEEDRRKSREVGFDAHLVKPADFGALQALLASFQAR